MRQVMITTEDNPFNPFTQFDDWYRYDMDKGYNTCGLLASIAKTSKDLLEYEYEEEKERAIDVIIDMHPVLKELPKNEQMIYKKVIKNVEPKYVTEEAIVIE